MSDEDLCYNCRVEDQIVRQTPATLTQENVSKSSPPKELQQESKKTYHTDRNCKHRVISHKHRVNVVHTHRSSTSKATSARSRKIETSVTSQQRLNCETAPSHQATLPSTQSPLKPIERIDLTRPCQHHIHNTLRSHRIDQIDVAQQRPPQHNTLSQQRIDQIERSLPLQQQAYNRNYRMNGNLRFGHLGERNALCSMCVCRWVNKRLY